jgi:hypothetical protein
MRIALQLGWRPLHLPSSIKDPGVQNEAHGMSAIEGKAARVAARERGQRASFNLGIQDQTDAKCFDY